MTRRRASADGVLLLSASVALLLPSAIEAQDSGSDGADPMCPCIQPWGEPAPSASSTRKATGLVSGRQISVRGDYGASECRRWEENVTELCGGKNPPSYCLSEWCYVNASTCARPFVLSGFSFQPSAPWKTGSMAYSYETCGFLNSYDTHRHQETIKQASPLRLTYPGDYEYFTVTKPDGTKDGSHVAFIKKIMDDVDANGKPDDNWKWTNLSADSRAWSKANKQGSSYWACVHDIAINRTDLCIGAFFVIPERRAMIPFTDTLENLAYKMLVFGKQEGFWDLVYKPFLVFTTNAWLAMAAMVFYLSCALSLITAATGEAEEYISHLPTFVDRICAVFHIHKKSHIHMRFFDRVISGVVEASYLGLIGFTGLAPVRNSKSLPARIVTAGFASFLLIVGATYTGGTAAALVSKSQAGAINSLQDILDAGAKICIKDTTWDLFKPRYPQFEGSVVDKENQDAVDAMDK